MMTYDPDTGLFGSDDSSSNLFATTSERFPWEITEDDEPDDGSDDVKPVIISAGDVPVGSVGRISYDRGTNEVVAGPVEVVRDSDARTGTRGPTKLERDAAERVRLRTAVDTGLGNIRRVAGQHKNGDSAGDAGGTRGPASSLTEAADRFKQSLRGTDHPANLQPSVPADGTGRVDDRIRHFVTRTLAGTQPHIDKQNWTKVERTRESEFSEVSFECMVQKVASNTAGDWIITIKIPYEDRGAATELGGAYGLALETRMVRRSSG